MHARSEGTHDDVSGMGDVEVSLTGQLVLAALRQGLDFGGVCVAEFQGSQHGSQRLVFQVSVYVELQYHHDELHTHEHGHGSEDEVPVRAAVVGPCLRGSAHDDLHAGVGRIVLAGPLLAVHVPEAVTVVLDELVVVHDFAEVRLPELLSALQIQPRPLQEQAVLQSAPVLQLVLPFQVRMQVLESDRASLIVCDVMPRRFAYTLPTCGGRPTYLHAQRHVDLGGQLHLVGGQVVDRAALLREVVAYELLVHILEQWADTGVCAHYIEAVGRLHEGPRKLHAEPSNDDRHEPLQRYVGKSTLKVN